MGKVLKIIGASCVVLVVSCTSAEQRLTHHQRDVEAWHAKRIKDLKGHDGWLNLEGLFWLNEGINSFGNDSTKDIVFPVEVAGYFFVKGGVVTMMIPPKDEEIIYHPDSTRSLAGYEGSFEWFVIRRGDKLGIRLRNFQSENVKNFKGIERFPVDYSWRITARFKPSIDDETIDITNVLGQTTKAPLAGICVFELDGKEQRLAATREDDKLLIVFGDETNGKETYGAGRFILVDRPDSTGNVVIDFNKSYNPPCAFTEFATCPLPPKQNVLSVSIPAGEKNYDYHGK